MYCYMDDRQVDVGSQLVILEVLLLVNYLHCSSPNCTIQTNLNKWVWSDYIVFKYITLYLCALWMEKKYNININRLGMVYYRLGIV